MNKILQERKMFFILLGMDKVALLLILVCFKMIAVGQTTAEAVFAKTEAALKGVHAVAYTIQYSNKVFSGADTMTDHVVCIAQKTSNRNANVFYNFIIEQPGFYFRKQQIYNGDTLANISVDDSLAGIAIRKYVNVDDYKFTSFLIKGLLEEGFFTKQITAATVKDITIKEVAVEGTACYEIKFINTDPVKKEHEYFHYTYYIDTSSFLPKGMIETVGFQDMVQYRAWVLSDLQLNPSVDKNTFGIAQNIKAKTIVKLYEAPGKQKSGKPQILEKGMSAPVISARTLDGDSFRLSEYKGKVVVLDFWYVSCYFCMMAMPDLQSLHEEFDTSEVVFIGLNPFDKTAQAKAFLDNKNITYTNVAVNHGDVNKYGVSAYPTLYVIDKQGNISASEEGWKGKRAFKASVRSKIKKALR